MGAGTTGLVFRAHDPVEGRLVAIKAFRLDLTPDRAVALAQALQGLVERGLSHPSIAAPIAAGVDDGVAWLAQAYVPAESLDSALRQYGPPPVADALTIVTQLAGALDFAAAVGVVHGSLHPRDVLVAPGETHLVDIGVAAALESCGVRAPVRRPYSAPERAAGGPLSRAGDIFALGATAFELLSGQPLIGGGDEAIVTLPEIPGANRELLLETFSFALALAPDERYATALAFAAPLKKALGEALTRPAAPRKRRATNPPEALLPIGGLESGSMSEPPPGPPPAAEPPETAARVAAADDEDLPARARPTRQATLRHAGLPESQDTAASVYPSGPTEPEPSLPAVEPIAAPGKAVPIAPMPQDGRYTSLDDTDSLSPLDAVELAPFADRARRWELPGPAQPDEPSGTAHEEHEEIAAPGPRSTGVNDPAYAFDETPATYAAAPHAAFEPSAGDYGTGEYPTTVDDRRFARSRTPWLGLAAMLLVGLVAGLVGGWLLFGGGGDRSSAGGAVASGAGAMAGSEEARETADAPVRQADGSAPDAAAGVPSTARPPGTAGEPRANAASPVAAATRVAEPPARGRLVVITRPAGARVEVGGQSRGSSPVTIDDLALGGHVVRFSRDGYDTAQRRVTLSASRPAQTIDVTLRRTPPPAPRPSRAARASPTRFVGTVVVESRPAGAKVFVDGRGVGVTPLTLPGVKAGSHVVRLEMIGYRRWSTPIRLVAGERERVAASLEEESVR